MVTAYSPSSCRAPRHNDSDGRKRRFSVVPRSNNCGAIEVCGEILECFEGSLGNSKHDRHLLQVSISLEVHLYRLTANQYMYNMGLETGGQMAAAVPNIKSVRNSAQLRSPVCSAEPIAAEDKED